MLIGDYEAKNIEVGDRIYLQYKNGLVKSGIHLGQHSLPWNKDRRGVCLTYDENQNLVDWIDFAFIEQMEITIPKNIVAKITAGRRKNSGR